MYMLMVNPLKLSRYVMHASTRNISRAEDYIVDFSFSFRDFIFEVMQLDVSIILLHVYRPRCGSQPASYIPTTTVAAAYFA